MYVCFYTTFALELDRRETKGLSTGYRGSDQVEKRRLDRDI